MIKPNTNRSFYYLTFTVVILLVLPVLIQDGMFMDGQQYACVARNLAQGKGTFWFPVLSETWLMLGFPFFMEQPPLFYGAEAIAFKLLGEGMYTERLFCLGMLVLNLFMIHQLWKLVVKDHLPERIGTSWYPMFLWIICPVCFWVFQNNMIEMLLSALTMAAVYFSLRSAMSKGSELFNVISASLFISLGFLCKGLPGLFPLVTIPLYYLVTGGPAIKPTIQKTFNILVLVILFFTALIVCNETAKISLRYYFVERLMTRVAQNPTVNNRFATLFNLLQELILPGVVLLALYLSARAKKEISKDRVVFKLGLFFILLGACGSLPLMLTMVQKNFYF